MQANLNTYINRTNINDQIQEVWEKLEEFRLNPRELKNAEEVEATEQEINGLTSQLSGLLAGLQVQTSLKTPERAG